MAISMNWTFYNLWNESLEQDKEKPLVARNHIWASELGGSFVDRYLRMTGVKPTNPPNPRSKRKFEAGNIWECIIGYVLNRAGILISRQKWIAYQYPLLLEVTGKLDYTAGGQPDYEKASSLLKTEFNWLPEFISRATLNIVNRLKEQYPDGLREIVLEIKSCSSFMFEQYESKNAASSNHRLQLFHYLKAENMTEGHIVYVCKDDARLIEIGVLNPSATEDLYKKDIETLTAYVQLKTIPPLENPIVFDDDFAKFSANWKIAYSQYLTHLYGFQNQMEFDNKYKPITERWNRVLGRIKDDKKMTDDNQRAIKEMAETGFDIDVVKSKISGKQQ